MNTFNNAIKKATVATTATLSLTTAGCKNYTPLQVQGIEIGYHTAEIIRAINEVLPDEFEPDMTNSTVLRNIQFKGVDGYIEEVRKKDPYTSLYRYADPNEIRGDRTDKVVKNSQLGFSINLTQENRVYVVGTVYLDSSAYKNGLRAGDILSTFNNYPISSMQLSDVEKLINTDKKGDPITVEIFRSGEGVKTITFAPTMEVTTVGEKSFKVKYLEDSKIAYVDIDTFALKDFGEYFKKLMKEIKKQGTVESMIIDLRGNGGGELEAARAMLAHFLKEETKMADSYDLNTKVRTPIKVPKNDMDTYFPTIPLVVLANADSASASELVIGALQDTERAVIVGTSTFGKGIGQTTESFISRDNISPGAVETKFDVKCTTFKLLLANDRFAGDANKNRIGLKPDIEVPPSIQDEIEKKDTYIETAKKILVALRGKK